MSHVEILKCDGCDQPMGEKEGAWLAVKSAKEELDLCLGCGVDVKRFLLDRRMSVGKEPVRKYEGRFLEQGIVFKPGKPLNPVPTEDEPKGES